MVGHRFVLTFSAILFPGSILFGQTASSPEPTPSASATPTPEVRSDRPDPKSRRERFREIRDKIENLPPDQRLKALEGIREWQEMSPDEKAHVRFVQEEREKRLRSAVEEALKATGLQLTEAQKVEFSKIYKAERRRLEETLRAEMDQHRRERLSTLQQNVVEAYRKQIGAADTESSPSATATPVP